MESYGTIQNGDLRIVNQQNRNEIDRNYIEFYTRAEKIEAKSTNGLPYFEDRIFVKIIPPGAKSWVDRRARESDFVQYPRQYEAFKSGQRQETAGGFPLDQWPGLLASQVAFFKSQNIFTVEQLSGIPDSSFSSFPIGTREIRQRAIDFLALAKNQAPMIELRKENEALKEQIALLKGRVDAFAAHMASEKKDVSLAQAADVAIGPVEPVKNKGKT